MKLKKITPLFTAAVLLTSCGTAPATEELSADTGTVWRGSRAYIDGITGEADNFIFRDGRVYFRTAEATGKDAIKFTLNSVSTDGKDLKSALYYEGTDRYFDCFTLDADGNIVLVETAAGDDLEVYDDDTYFLKTLSPEGDELSSTDITDAVRSTAGGYFYVNSMVCGNDGSIYISNYAYIAAFTPAGELIFGTPTEESIYTLALSASGDVYAKTYSDGYALQKVDPSNGELGGSVKLSDRQYDYQSVPHSGAGDADLYVDDGTSLLSLDIEADTRTEILNWVDSDLIRDEISGIFPLENEEGFVCTGLSYPAGNPVITVIKPKNASELPKRTELTMAGSEYAIGFPLEYQAVKFNLENENYRINIRKYTGEDYLTGLNADILSGNIPDILVTDSQINMESYTAKGLFLDMYPFIDSDSELDRSDFLPNVLSAFETDGHLYSFTDSFMIYTIFGKRSIFGEKGIDFSRLAQIKENFPADTVLFPGVDKSGILQYGLMMSADNFIDYQAGECYFDSEEFIALLEFADTFPVSAEAAIDDSFWRDLDTMFSAERSLFMIPMITCYEDFYCYEREYFADTVTEVGFPSLSGKAGSSISFTSGFALSAKSEYPEGAWEFVRTLLSPEYQDAEESFPVRQSSLESKAVKTMTPGNNNIYSPILIMGDISIASSYWMDDTPEQSDIDRVNDIISSAERLYVFNSTVRDIVNEEASVYFAGSKSSREAAEMIQSRVKLYLSEIS